MTNTEAVEPTPRKQISIPVPSLKLSRLAQLIVVALVAVAVTAAAFLIWGPSNPIPDAGQGYKVPGGTLSITHDGGNGTFTPFTNPQYVYVNITTPGTVSCLKDKGYAGVQAPYGIATQLMIVDSVDYYACS
jgi:hypothetical protein